MPNPISSISQFIDVDRDGYSIANGDCEPNNNQVYPTAPQRLGDVINDCNDRLAIQNLIDSGAPQQEIDEAIKTALSPVLPQDAVTLNVGGTYPDFASGDVDGDGKKDLFVCRNGNVYGYLGKSNRFQVGQSLTTSNYDFVINAPVLSLAGLAVYDIDGNGFDDIITDISLNDPLHAEGDQSGSGGLFTFFGRATINPQYTDLSYANATNDTYLRNNKMGIRKYGADNFAVSKFDVDSYHPSNPDLVVFYNDAFRSIELSATNFLGYHSDYGYRGGITNNDPYKDISGNLVTGDFDRDGKGDFAISDYLADGFSNGRVWLIYGGGNGWINQEANTIDANDLADYGIRSLVLYGADDGYSAGYKIAKGDSNNDGYDDLYISAKAETANNQPAAGCLWNNNGYEMSLKPAGSSVILNEEANAMGSYSICGDATNMLFSAGGLIAGDFNGNGSDDIATSIVKRAVTFPGECLDMDAGQRLYIDNAKQDFSSQASWLTGQSLISDFDGDGIDDVLLTDTTGAGYIVFGGQS